MTVPQGPKPILWLPDTSSLLSLAVDPQLSQVVKAELSVERCALLDVVADELDDLARPGGSVSGLAQAALGQISWLGPVVATEKLSDPEGVLDIQNTIRAGRPLKHPREHWAESVILDIGERLKSVAPRLLSEDYDARVEAPHHSVLPFSVHKVLATMVRGSRLSAVAAEGFATALHRARRGPEITAAEFTRGDLRRVGRP